MENHTQYSYEEFTPEKAEDALRFNTNNRGVRRRLVDRLSRDMKNGFWRHTGETIKFSRKGRLIDGQHRLLAVVESGTPVWFDVIRGLEDDVQMVIDTGSARTAGDALKMSLGVSNGSGVAAAARLAILARRGNPNDRTQSTSHSETQEFVAKNPSIIESVLEASRYKPHISIRPAALAYAHFEMSLIDREEADSFWRDVAYGENLHRNDPAMTLSRHLRGLSKIPSANGVPNDLSLSASFKMWNARRRGVAEVSRIQKSDTLPKLI